MLPDHLERIARLQSDTKRRTERLESMGSGANRLIDSAVLAAPAALVTFANIPNIYRHLKIRMYARTDRVATSESIRMRFNGDAGANYDSIRALIFTPAVLATVEIIAGTEAHIGSVAAATAPANVFDGIEITIFNYSNTIGQKVARSIGTTKTANAVNNLFVSGFSAWWRNVASINTAAIFPLANNFVAGCRFDLYGIQGGP